MPVRKEIDLNKVRKLNDGGATIADIAQQLGVNRLTLIKRCAEQGIKLCGQRGPRASSRPPAAARPVTRSKLTGEDVEDTCSSDLLEQIKKQMPELQADLTRSREKTAILEQRYARNLKFIASCEEEEDEGQ